MRPIADVQRGASHSVTPFSAQMLFFDDDWRANADEPIKVADILVVHSDTAV